MKRDPGPSGRSSNGDADVVARADLLATRMEELSSQIDKARRYIPMAAHEILTPLTIMKGELELALKQDRRPDEDRATFEVVLGQTQQLVSLSMDILAFATAGTSEADATPDEVRLKDVVDDAVRACRTAGAMDVDVDDLVVQGRRDDLVRLVRNLVDNAIEHGPRGSRVRVRGRADRTGGRMSVLLTVQDEGPGIPTELHERIFEPFFRTRDARRRSGSGLGLAIARELARAHGGDVQVDASCDNTRFAVVLPAQGN